MDRTHTDQPNTRLRSEDRLLRDLAAVGRLEVGRRPAVERLTAILGQPLLRAINAELRHAELGASTPERRPRRIA